MNRVHYIMYGFVAIAGMLGSCVSRGNDPGWEYAPDMYYSKGYEPYTQGDSAHNSLNPLGLSMREPVTGSIALGQLDYVYDHANTADGYEAAKADAFPADFGDDHGLGKYKYEIYCSPCHGKTGGNDGEVFKRVSTLKPAWKGYQDEYIKTLPVGAIYHVITYGKNNMGSHAHLLSPYERWAVIKYVKQLSGAGIISPEKSDTAKTNIKK